MKFQTLLIPALALLLNTAGAQTDSIRITKEMALKAIEIFRSEPLSERGEAATAIVIQFAEKSPDIIININTKTCPWFGATPEPKHTPLLLGAYIVGNTKSQLDSGIYKNDSYAGVLQVIATYRQIQKAEPDYKVSEVEKLIELNAQNKLKAYLESPEEAAKPGHS